MSDCLFCKIAAGEIPADKVFENDDAVAFRDIHPQAPVHVLVVPRQHVASLDEADEQEGHEEDDEDGFKIERSIDGASFTEIATVGPNITTYSDRNLDEDTTYYYRIIVFVPITKAATLTRQIL